MNITLPRLYQKEIRQITPVLIAVVVLGLILFLVRLAYGNESQSAIALTCELTMFLAPMYAIGAAAILISQEKELRTIGWLQSMPIPASRIVLAKALVSFIGFLTVCVLSRLLIMPWMDSDLREAVDTFSGSRAYSYAFSYDILSFYVLAAASAACWRTSSLAKALLLFLFLAVGPKVVESIVLYVVQTMIDAGMHASISDYERNTFSFIVLPTSFAMCALAYYWGVSNLTADSTGPSVTVGRFVSAWRPSLSVQWLSREKLLNSSSALIWQTFRQFGWAVLLPSVAILVLLTMGVPAPNYNRLNELRGLGVVCWLSFLGVWTYHSDSSHRRMRFLSDRGVSGGRIWCYRIGIMALIVVAIAMIGRTALIDSTGRAMFGVTGAFGAIGVVLAIYGITQWSSQLAHSLVLGLVQTPIFLIFTMFYAGYFYFYMGIPFLILILMAVIPYVVTRLAMQSWIEGRWERRFWLTHGIGFGCWLLLPLSMWFVTYLSVPRMNDALRAELKQESNRWGAPYTSYGLYVGEFGMSPYLNNTGGVEIMKLEDAVALNLKTIRGQYAFNNASINLSLDVDGNSLRRLETLALMTSFFSQDTSAEESEANKKWKEHFQSTISIVVDAIPRVRQNRTIIQQDYADLLEILLLEHLKNPKERELLSDEILAQCQKVLRDRDHRKVCRRRAIAASWEKYLKDAKTYRTSYVDFGGYSFEAFVDMDKQRRGWSSGIGNISRVDQIIESLWKIANDSGVESDQELIKLAKLCGRATSSATAPVRANDLAHFYMIYPNGYSYLPACQWNANWEKEAESFGKESLSHD